MNPGVWHADHVIPWSKGGKTVISNAQALCVPCNVSKSDKMNPLHYVPAGEQLRTWQIEFIDRFIAWSKEQLALPLKERKSFVLNAFPGSGKTWAQLIVTKCLIEEKFIQKVAVCVPSDKLRTDFAQEARTFGLNLYVCKQKVLCDLDEYDGLVLTYAQLRNPQTSTYLEYFCSTNKVLVSADEMHHLSKNRSWGTSFQESFQKAELKLKTSGTAFRSDGAPIPGVRYLNKSIDLSAPHAYSYGYGISKWNPSQSALSDGVVRDVVFHPWDGEVRFVVKSDDGEREYCHKLSDNLDEIYKDELPSNEIAKLKSLRRQFCIECGTERHPNGTNYVREQIKAAHLQLSEIRSTLHPHAGGLIVCQDRKHADAVALVVREITGTQPVVVHGDSINYKKKLEAFQLQRTPSREPWLIAVKMVTEGVDIKHLRVCVYLTTETAPLFWTQVLGRILRVERGIPFDSQTAHFYQYDDGVDNTKDGEEENVRLRYFAQSLLEEKEFTIKEEKEKKEPHDNDGEENRGCVICRNPWSLFYTGGECPGPGKYPCPKKAPPEVINLGATGECNEQIYNGDRYELKELELFKPLEVRWNKPAVACKYLIDSMLERLRDVNYLVLQQDFHNNDQ